MPDLEYSGYQFFENDNGSVRLKKKNWIGRWVWVDDIIQTLEGDRIWGGYKLFDDVQSARDWIDSRFENGARHRAFRAWRQIDPNAG